MRIGLNARNLAAADPRGFNRYTAELARALAASGRCEVVLFSDAPLHPVHELGHLPLVVAPVRPQWRWQHRWLPRALREARAALFHAPAHWGVPWRPPCPVVVTIHDLADRERPEDSTGGPLRARLRHRLEERLAVRRAARIITVSRWSARSITRHLGVPSERIAVTVEGASSALVAAAAALREGRGNPTVEAVRDRYALPGRYFLVVGGFEARKNLEVIVRALALMPEAGRETVALVGRTGPDADALMAAAHQAGVEPFVRLLGAVPDRELAALLAGAVALVMPSRLEGFGLPVVEAMHAGTPAIVSNAAALPEVTGDAGLVVEPDDAAALAAAMRRLAAVPEARAVLAERARDRARRYTWEQAAEQTLAVYEAVVAGR